MQSCLEDLATQIVSYQVPFKSFAYVALKVMNIQRQPSTVRQFKTLDTE